MESLARSYVWWPNINIESTVKECTELSTDIESSKKEAPLHPWEWLNQPWERLYIDYAGPINSK